MVAPVAVTVKVALAPLQTACAAGCAVIAGAALIVTVTALLVTLPHVFVITTS